MCTSTIAALTVESEVNLPDANALAQLAILQRNERNSQALIAWLKDNLARLAGLPWRASSDEGEILIDFFVVGCGEIRPQDVASRFPGGWKCKVRSRIGDRFLDWTAERDGILIRIQAAEKIEPAPVHPLAVTF